VSISNNTTGLNVEGGPNKGGMPRVQSPPLFWGISTVVTVEKRDCMIKKSSRQRCGASFDPFQESRVRINPATTGGRSFQVNRIVSTNLLGEIQKKSGVK